MVNKPNGDPAAQLELQRGGFVTRFFPRPSFDQPPPAWVQCPSGHGGDVVIRPERCRLVLFGQVERPWGGRSRDEPSPNLLRKPGVRSRCSSLGSPGRETALRTGTTISQNRQRSFNWQSSPVSHSQTSDSRKAYPCDDASLFLPDSA